MQQTQPRKPLAEKFALSTERLGPLPLVNHFIARLGLIELLDQYVPTTDRRCAVPHATALGVLLRSIVVEREPIYCQVETVHGFAPAMYGLGEQDLGHLGDDRLGRALDRLYDADRGALLTAVVLAVGKCFAVKFEELHNDSTSIRFCGQYRVQPETVRGQHPARIVYGFSKDHRPDLKQLLFILTTTEDGGVPVTLPPRISVPYGTESERPSICVRTANRVVGQTQQNCAMNCIVLALLRRAYCTKAAANSCR